MERLRPFIDKLTSAIYKPLAPELIEFQAKIIKGEISELLSGGKVPRIFDHYGDTLRIRIPWGENGLEKSYIAKLDEETREVSLKPEGFFLSDRRDWPK